MNSYYLLFSPDEGGMAEAGPTQDHTKAMRIASISAALAQFGDGKLSANRWAIVKISGQAVDPAFCYRYGYNWTDADITDALQAWGFAK